MLDQMSGAAVADAMGQAAGVDVDKMRVVMLSPSKYLVTSKGGVDVPKCAMEMPEEWWVRGFKAERWSPLTGAGVKAPSFKAWVDFIGLLPHLRREEYVAQAVGEFGVFLGSVPNQDTGDWSSWGVVVAVPDLGDIPHEVLFTACALEYNVRVVGRRWISGQVYSSGDFPKLPKRIVLSSERSLVVDFNGDSLTIKLQDLHRIFRHVPAIDLSADIRAAMAEQNVDDTNAKGKAMADKAEVVKLLRRDLSVMPKVTDSVMTRMVVAAQPQLRRRCAW